MHTETAQSDYFRQLAERLQQAGHGERGQLVDGAAAFLGISRNQVYAQLRRFGWRSGKKLRADRGRTSLLVEELQAVSNIMVESCRANGKRLLGVKDALDIARANGMVAADVAPKTVMRSLREAGLHPDQLKRATPYMSMRSLHPNHCWQFDVSVCVLFYLDTGGLGVMDQKKFYKNKPDNIAKISKQRVLRYLITDHYSGALFVRYYMAAGEDQETLFRFLMDAFGRREHEQDPFHGVPFKLVWDAGSANQSHLIRNLLDRLDVHHWAHVPGNPRAKGQVENGHNLVECHFEGRLSFMKVRDIDHLNQVAAIWMRHFNGVEIHSRHGQTRYGLWQTIRADQLRIAPSQELCSTLLRTKPEARQVQGNLMVKYAVKGFGPAFYSVAHVPNVRVGEQIEVCLNPYHAPSIYAVIKDEHGVEQHIACEPAGRDAAGFLVDAPVIGQQFRAAPDTDVDTNRKALAKEAYGADTQAEVDEARRKKEPAFGGAVDPITYLEDQHTVSYMRRRGTELDVPAAAQVDARPLSIVQALKYLKGRLGTLDAQQNAWLREHYPEGVPESDLESLVAELRGDTAAPSRPGLSVVK